MASRSPTIFLKKIPVEIITTILIHVDVPTLLRCRATCRDLAATIQDSVQLQYKIELFASNMIDGDPSSPISTLQRLEMLRVHQKAWNDLDWSSVFPVDISILSEPMDGPLTMGAWEFTGGVLGLARGSSFRFIRCGSSPRGVKREEWTIENVGYNMKDFGMDVSQDLLAILENAPQGETDTCHLHLTSLRDGSNHSKASTPLIPFITNSTLPSGPWFNIQIYKDFVGVMVITYDDDMITSKVSVWNWKTGVLLKVVKEPSIRSFSFLSDKYLLIGTSLGGVFALQVFDIYRVDLQFSPEATVEQPACTFFYPPLTMTRLEARLSIRTDYNNASDDAPFTTSPHDLLIIITVSRDEAPDFITFMKASTLLSLIPEHSGSAIEWHDWTRNAHFEQGVISQEWGCSVFGMKAVVRSCDGTSLKLFDFNQHLAKREGPQDSEYCRRNGLEYFLERREFKDMNSWFELDSPPECNLPCRVKSILWPDAEDDTEFMLGQDALIVIPDFLARSINVHVF